MKRFSFLAMIILVTSHFGGAQYSTSRSYVKAMEALSRALDAYGGLERISSIENFSIKLERTVSHRNQSRRPEVTDRTVDAYELVVDFKGNRFYSYSERGVIGGNRVVSYDVFDGRSSTFGEMLYKTKRSRPPAPNWREGFPTNWLPQLLLLNLHKSPAGLSHIGTAIHGGRLHDLIHYSAPDGNLLTLYFDRETFLLSKQESMIADPVGGDALRETIYHSYRTVNGFKVPTETSVKIAGQEIVRTRYLEAAFDGPLTDERFTVRFEFRDVPPAPEPPAITRHGQNIYTVRAGGYNVLVVDFRDHIFVMEAPGGEAVSKETIAKINEIAPGKPIKYLGLTHFHDDHIAGARTYIARGSILVTTNGNRSYFQRMALSRFLIAPDALASDPKPLRLEFISGGKRVFFDGHTTLELHEIRGGPHADEMLVAYFPRERILFQGDLFDRPASGDLPIANAATVHFAKWLENARLPVERIVPVHGAPMSMADLRRSLSSSQQPSGDSP